jgi:uncharacterized protein
MKVFKIGLGFLGLLGLVYLGGCGYLFLNQRQAIYYPAKILSANPGDAEFQIPYDDVQFVVDRQTIKGWWLPAPQPQEVLDLLPGEPRRILKQPKVLLYLCGVGPNMGAKNYLTRVEALRQLGFSVLIFDYRGYGNSGGDFPQEQRIYEDAIGAWNYLTQIRKIAPQDILIYGESMGGAVAIELAQRQPQAWGLIVQSSFTSMADVIKSRRQWYSYFPIEILLTEKFDSISKVESLEMPVLFIHGTEDGIVPVQMSQQLYEQASSPKQLFLVQGGAHVRIYQPGQSYLEAITKFLQGIVGRSKAGVTP